MVDSFRALCAELTDKLHQYAETFPEHDVAPLVQRARDLLDLDEPEGEGLTDEELNNIHIDLVLPGVDSKVLVVDSAYERCLMRAAIAADRARRPSPQPPADGEVAELVG